MHMDSFQTLADPTRRRIVETLRAGEHAVNDIVDRVAIHQSGVSRHLRILHAAGFVQVRPDGPRRLYSLRPEPFLELEDWIGRYRTLWEARLDSLAEALAHKQKARAANKGTHMTKSTVTLERTLDGSIEDVWELWTTKDGIEAWWGPGGFAVTVRKLDLRPGGQLHYAMTAIDPQHIAYMKKEGMPVTTELRITYTEIDPPRRLVYTHLTDFIPGVEPYDVETVVELHPSEQGVRLVLTFDAMHDDEWTQRATMGWEGELGKLEALLATRA
jgi:uncharacterized protein YndB with AHSA1/START domain/DNA-binding transcriptional ArsR family regulator